MANLLRIKLPEGVQRFKMFNVEDYRDFILIRKDIEGNPVEEQEIFDELLEELYPEQDKSYRGYLFINMLTSSLAKRVIPIEYICPNCKGDVQVALNLRLPALTTPVIETAGLKITFKYPDKEYDDPAQKFYDCIYKVADQDSEYLWSELDVETKDSVIAAITYTSFQEAITKISPVMIKQDVRCKKCGHQKTIVRDSALEVFKLLLSPDEIILFYRINRILTRSGYSNQDLMSMLPLERSIALSLIEKENTQNE